MAATTSTAATSTAASAATTATAATTTTAATLWRSGALPCRLSTALARLGEDSECKSKQK